MTSAGYGVAGGQRPRRLGRGRAGPRAGHAPHLSIPRRAIARPWSGSAPGSTSVPRCTAWPARDCPCVILHGWGLAHHAYKGAIQRLVAQGCRVYAPAQPGFGGTAELPKREFSLAGYARWVERFLEAVAHRRAGLPDRALVRRRRRDPVRPRLPRAGALARARQLDRRVGLEGGLEAEVARRPSAVGLGAALPERHVADPAGHAGHPDHARGCAAQPAAQPSIDAQGGRTSPGASTSRYELEALKRRELPVVVLWGNARRHHPEGVVRRAVCCRRRRGSGRRRIHSWLLADPDGFGEVITNEVEVARVARRARDRVRLRAEPASSARTASACARCAPWSPPSPRTRPSASAHSGTSGTRGPAMRRSSRRRVTPRASSSAISGIAYLRRRAEGLADLRHGDAVGMLARAVRRDRQPPRRSRRLRTRSRRARRRGRGARARAARPGRRRRGAAARTGATRASSR